MDKTADKNSKMDLSVSTQVQVDKHSSLTRIYDHANFVGLLESFSDDNFGCMLIIQGYEGQLYGRRLDIIEVDRISEESKRIRKSHLAL